MRIVLGLMLAALGGRTPDGLRVVVGWEDGFELELGAGSETRDRLVTLARGALP